MKVYSKSDKRETTSGVFTILSPELSTGFLVSRGCSNIMQRREGD